MRWPLIIIGFFVVLITVNGIFLTLALQTREAPVSSYVNAEAR
ncbi:MAG: hypothetical protein ACI9MC_002241 [Kiritimatiellia bacterium]|jgi:hypothetical protein